MLVGKSDLPVCGPPASLFVHLASIAITQAGSFHKSRGDNVVHMWVHLKRWCVSCVWVLQMGNSGDGCDLASTLCKYDMRKGDLFIYSEFGQGCDEWGAEVNLQSYWCVVEAFSVQSRGCKQTPEVKKYVCHTTYTNPPAERLRAWTHHLVLTPYVIVGSRHRLWTICLSSYAASGIYDWRVNGIQLICEGVCLPADEQCVVTRYVTWLHNS